MQDSSCPALLRIPTAILALLLPDFHRLWSGFPDLFKSRYLAFVGPYPSLVSKLGLGSFPFARRYSENRVYFLFLRLLRCFSSLRSLPYLMCSDTDDMSFLIPGFPIRKSMAHCLLAAPHGLSQLTTSFFGSKCQGIHHAPLAI